jgi:hypothetical protein
MFPKIICFLWLIVASNISSAQQEWRSFTPKGERFEILVPGEMKSGEKKLLTEIGEIHPITWIYEGKSDENNNLYMISYVDYPESMFHEDSLALIKEFLEVSMETHIEDLKGDLVYKSDAPYGLFPGIIYRASYNSNKHVVKSRMILIGNRFYALQVYTTSEKSLNNDMNRFLESFRARI